MGTGRGKVADRLLRHFSLLNFAEMDEETLKTISEKILVWGFR